MPEHLDELHPQGAAQDAPHQQDDPHLEIHVAQAVVGQGAGGGGADDLVGIGSGRHGGRDADHDEEGGHQKPAAHAENARQQSHESAHDEDQNDIDAIARNRKVEVPHSAIPFFPSS